MPSLTHVYCIRPRFPNRHTREKHAVQVHTASEKHAVQVHTASEKHAVQVHTAQWKCTVEDCTSNYANNDSLKRHVKAKHTTIKCTECGDGCAGTDGLRTYVCVRARVCARR